MQTLKQLRNKIDKIDAEIIKNLSERLKLSKQIGELKKESSMAVTDDIREKELLEYYEHLSHQYAMDAMFVKRLFKIIIQYSRKLQS